MDPSGTMILIGGVLLLGFFTLVVWWGLRYELRKTELAHIERKIAMENGLPLPDAEIARCRALGWIGATVPSSSLSLAVGATALLVPPRIPESSLGVLIAVWSACGVVAVSAVIAAIMRLRSAPVAKPVTPPSDVKPS